MSSPLVFRRATKASSAPEEWVLKAPEVAGNPDPPATPAIQTLPPLSRPMALPALLPLLASITVYTTCVPSGESLLTKAS